MKGAKTDPQENKLKTSGKTQIILPQANKSDF